MFKTIRNLIFKNAFLLFFLFFMNGVCFAEEESYFKIPLAYEKSSKPSTLNKVHHYLSFGFGPAKFFNFGTQASAYHFQVRSDHDFKKEFSAILKAAAAFDEAGSYVTNGSMGLRVCLGSEVISAFLGADLGLGLIGSGKKAFLGQDIQPKESSLHKRRFGFLYGGSMGVQFFRGSTVHCELGMNFLRSAKKLNEEVAYPGVASFYLSISSKTLT